MLAAILAAAILADDPKWMTDYARECVHHARSVAASQAVDLEAIKDARVNARYTTSKDAKGKPIFRTKEDKAAAVARLQDRIAATKAFLAGREDPGEDFLRELPGGVGLPQLSIPGRTGGGSSLTRPPAIRGGTQGAFRAFQEAREAAEISPLETLFPAERKRFWELVPELAKETEKKPLEKKTGIK